ncbi:hypothetical protein BCR44DRAFT_103739, partial [Catenaria anguillulae PL171]
GKSVIVSSDAPKFLAWAATKFEVAVCSLGEQMYVDQVCGLLDPDGSKITGPRFSARQEYNYVSKNGADRAAVLRKPVKSLAAMYPFAASHHDNIILVDRNRQSHSQPSSTTAPPPPARPTDAAASTTPTGPWDVCLFPVVASLLDRVHAGYFRKLEDW